MQRLLDLALTVPVLLVSWPLFLLVAAIIKWADGGNVLYRQQRVGRHGVEFTLLKFRSMRPSVGLLEVTARNDQRITPVGRFLRKAKLDELPELWNVLRGEMSLVGPRPEVPRYVNFEDERWREVLKHRPGITDPVTLSLRNEEDLLEAVSEDRERFYRDVLQPYKLRGYLEYGAQRTVASDMVVLARTLVAIVMPSRAPGPTMKELQQAVTRVTE